MCYIFLFILCCFLLYKFFYGYVESYFFWVGVEFILFVLIEFNLFFFGLRSLKEDILIIVDKNLVIYFVDYDLVD